jgi:hypothetical protein
MQQEALLILLPPQAEQQVPRRVKRAEQEPLIEAGRVQVALVLLSSRAQQVVLTLRKLP